VSWCSWHRHGRVAACPENGARGGSSSRAPALVGVLVFAALMFSAGPASAASAWYVSPGGDSTTPCTLASPCNLEYAVASAASGDTIELESGDYTASNDGQGSYPLRIDPSGSETLTIEAVPGDSVALDGSGTGQVLFVSDAGGTLNLTLDGLTIENGSVPDGAGLEIGGNAAVTIKDSSFINNHAGGLGGAIYGGDGPITIENTTFLNNTAGSVGGAIESAAVPLSVDDSTFSGNTAVNSGGAIDNQNVAVITASTIVGNQSGHYGGALSNGYRMTVLDSTFSGNAATGSGNDVYQFTGATLDLAGSLLEDGCAAPSAGADLFYDDGYNASPEPNGCTNGGTGDVIDPSVADLGSLADNGGRTETLRPAAGNAAIGAIPDPASVVLDGAPTQLCPTGDQTGALSGGSPCTIGSVFVGYLAQLSPASSSVPDGAGYSGQLTVSGATGTVSYLEAATGSSSQIVVARSGAITAPDSLAPGTYRVTGTDSDTGGDAGTWSFTLVVEPASPAPAQPSTSPPPLPQSAPRAAPRLRLLATRRASKVGSVAFEFACLSGTKCQGTATVSISRVAGSDGKKRATTTVIAKGTFVLADGRSKTVDLRETPVGEQTLNRLGAKGNLRVKLVVELAGGSPTVVVTAIRAPGISSARSRSR
jgi:predicted outer membrane repeat protein